jgi:HSP20 family protein
LSDPRRTDPFAELYGDFSDRLRGDRWQPDIDVFETEAAIVVVAEIAGIRSEDLRVTVDGEELRISGVRRVPERTDLKRLLQMEIAAGPFERRLRIAIPFDRENVSAHLSDGFLTVTLPHRGPQRRQVKLDT